MKSAGRRKENNFREMICISLIVMVLMGVVFVQSSRLQKKNEGYEMKIAQLTQEIAKESERTEEIEELKAYINTPEYAGEAAMEKLGMARENEILFRARE